MRLVCFPQTSLENDSHKIGSGGNEIKARFRWVTLYLETDDAGLVCRKCGISRPTLRRNQSDGMAGLQSKCKRPKKTPEKKVTEQVKQWILELRKRRLGSRRIQSEIGAAYKG